MHSLALKMQHALFTQGGHWKRHFPFQEMHRSSAHFA